MSEPQGEVVWERDDGNRNRTEVRVIAYEGGGGQVIADAVGPRGGRSNLYYGLVSRAGHGEQQLRRRIERERELQDQVLAAIDRLK